MVERVTADNESLATTSGRDSVVYNNCSVFVQPDPPRKGPKSVYLIAAVFFIWGWAITHVIATAHQDVTLHIRNYTENALDKIESG